MRIVGKNACVCCALLSRWQLYARVRLRDGNISISRAFAFGSINISGSQQLTQADIIRLSGSPEPFNLFNASLSRVQEALSHDIRFFRMPQYAMAFRPLLMYR